VRKLLSVACLVGGLAATACAPPQGSTPVTTGDTVALPAKQDLANDDLRSRIGEMRVRFPPTAVGTPAQRAAAASELYIRHEQYRRSLGLPDNPIAERERLISLLSNVPRDEAVARSQHEALTIRQEVARLDERQVTAADLSRLAANHVNATRPDLSREQRGAAHAAAEGEFRRELEARRSSFAAASAQRREADLTRLALTGLADMPREITLAAAENLSDARSPFDTRPNWRPDPAALRQEEVRLRNAIASRMEAERRQADQNARASANAAASHQQADLQRAIEMARADAERERRERQSQRLMEIGFGMMAGANRPPPPSNDGIRTYNINGRMFTCTTSGTFTNCF
jgi:hypothetical protein